jgi:NADPH:quinone reductase-like Zn-dependent oxidoreductase
MQHPQRRTGACEDFTQGTTRYGVIFDNIENRSLADCRRVLAPTGTLILNSGTGTRGLRTLVRLAAPLVLSPFVRQNLRRFLSVPNHDDLVVLANLVEAGKLRPVIDRRFPLQDAAAAIHYVESGHSRGKIIITLEPAETTSAAPDSRLNALVAGG